MTVFGALLAITGSLYRLLVFLSLLGFRRIFIVPSMR